MGIDDAPPVEMDDVPEIEEVEAAPDVVTPDEIEAESEVDVPASEPAVETPAAEETEPPPAGHALEDEDPELALDDLNPNSEYVRNGYTYLTDNLGRPRSVSGTIMLNEGGRTPQQTEIGHLGEDGDEGGHLIGARFDGPTDAFNIVPQAASLNRGEWKAMENEWVAALESGSQVEVVVEPNYESETIRPDTFLVTYSIDGEIYLRLFENHG